MVGQIDLKKVRLSSGSEDKAEPPALPPIPDPDPEGGAPLPLPLPAPVGAVELDELEEPEFPDTELAVKAE